MNPLETIQQHIKAFQQCPDTESNKSFNLISATFPLLTTLEKATVTYAFELWGKESESIHKLPFVKYLRALNSFFAEDYESMMPIVFASKELFTQQNNLDGMALCSSMIGSVYRTLGNKDLALKELWEGHEQLKKSGAYPHNYMACSYQIASLYVEMNHLADALPLFESTLKLAEEFKNVIWINNAQHGIGKVYLIQKDYSKAKDFLERGLASVESFNIPNFTATSLTDLATYYYETVDYAKAEELSTKALLIREERKFTGGAITNLIQLAEIYLKQEKYEAALPVLKRGLVFAQEIKVKPKIYQLHLLLSKVYEKLGDKENSLQSYKLYHQVNEEVEKEDNAKKVKNIQLVFEAEQTKKENIIIKKQKAEIEQKNIQLQDTIDELTRTKVGKKAKAITLIIAIVLFMVEELILHTVLHLLPEDNFTLSFIIKMVIIFSLKPIDTAVEHFLLSKLIKKKKHDLKLG